METATRWLDDEEQALWRMYLVASRKIERGMDEALVEASQMSSSDYAVLVTLSEAHEHTLRLRDIASEVGWDRSRTSHQVARMEKRGLVRKCRSKDDGRGVTVCITDEGFYRLQQAAPQHVESVRRLFFDHLALHDREAVGRFLQGVLAVDNLPGLKAIYPGDIPGVR